MKDRIGRSQQYNIMLATEVLENSVEKTSISYLSKVELLDRSANKTDKILTHSRDVEYKIENRFSLSRCNRRSPFTIQKTRPSFSLKLPKPTLHYPVLLVTCLTITLHSIVYCSASVRSNFPREFGRRIVPVTKTKRCVTQVGGSISSIMMLTR